MKGGQAKNKDPEGSFPEHMAGGRRKSLEHASDNRTPSPSSGSPPAPAEPSCPCGAYSRPSRAWHITVWACPGGTQGRAQRSTPLQN